MENMFAQLIVELKENLAKKTEELMNSESFNAHSQGKINNVSGRISGLENSAKEITQIYAGNKEMELNFKKRANDIKQEIEELTC